MDARVSFITLAVADLAATRRFYVDGLGWTPELDVDDVVMIRAGERLVLSLWDERSFTEEVGPIRRGPGLVPMRLAHNVATKAEVDAVLATSRGCRGGSRARGGRAGVGWLHRVLRRSRRVPLGGRLQPR